MEEMQPISAIAPPPKLEDSPLYRRLQTEKGYSEADLNADLQRFRDVDMDRMTPEWRPLYAVAKAYAEAYRHENRGAQKRAYSEMRKPLEQTFAVLAERCDDKMVTAIAQHLQQVSRSGDPATGLLIFGGFGTYKTWLCKATRAEAIASGNTAIIYPIRKLVADVQKTYAIGGATQDQVIRQILDHRIICLDDLGREKGSEDAARIVSSVIDAIYLEKDQHTLVVTTNGTAQGLSMMYEGAMLSRIRDMCDQVAIELTDTRGKRREHVLGGADD